MHSENRKGKRVKRKMKMERTNIHSIEELFERFSACQAS